MTDIINHPQHYEEAAGKLEPIDFCRLFPFCFGNACKYMLRAGHKGDEQTDLRKALKYLEWSCEELISNQRLADDIYNYRHLARRFNNPWLNVLFDDLDTTRVYSHAERACFASVALDQTMQQLSAYLRDAE